MDGRHPRRPMRGIEVVAADDDHRHAVAPGIVDAHRRMLQADGTMHQSHQGLAGDLEVAVRHADRGLFMHAGQKFRLLVLAVVDQRLVQRAETRCRIAGQVFDVERLDDVDHEIRAGLAAFVAALDFLRRAGFSSGHFGIRRQRGRTRLGAAGASAVGDVAATALGGVDVAAAPATATPARKFTSIEFGSRIVASQIVIGHCRPPIASNLTPRLLECSSSARLVEAMLVQKATHRYGGALGY